MKAYRVITMVSLLLLAVCCSKEPELTYDINLATNSISLYSLEEFQIEATSDYPLTYESADEYNATVDAQGKVKAFFIGSTTITVSNAQQSKSIPVTVKPKYNTYNEPTIPFGITPDELLSKAGTPDSRLNEKKYEIVTLKQFLETNKDTWRFVQMSGTIKNPTAKYPERIQFEDGGYSTTMNYLLTDDIYHATDAIAKFGIKDGDYITINCTHGVSDRLVIDAATYIEPQNVKEYFTYRKYQPSIVNGAIYLCQAGKYAACALSFSFSKAVELAAFLSERYLPVTKDEDTDTYVFVDAVKEANATQLITLTIDTSACTVMYIPYGASTKSSDNGAQELIEEFKDYLK